MMGDTHEERYTDLSPFVRLLGTKGRVQILDALINKPDRELTASEIAELTDTSPSTISRNIGDLIKLEMVVKHESESGPARYRINTESEIVQTLVRFHIDLSEHAEEILHGTKQGDRDIGVEIARNQINNKTKSNGKRRSDEVEREVMRHALADT